MEKNNIEKMILSSDRNLKENIKELPEADPTTIGKATNVKIKSFNFKDEPDNTVYGVIAQEVQDAGLGELVYQKDDGTLAVDYTSLMVLKIMALETRFHSLAMSFNPINNMVMEFNDKLNELEKRISELENKDK